MTRVYAAEKQGIHCSSGEAPGVPGLALEMCAPTQSPIHKDFNVTLTLTYSGSTGVRLRFVFLVNMTGRTWNTLTQPSTMCGELVCSVWPDENITATGTVNTLSFFGLIVPGTGQGLILFSMPAPPGDYILEGSVVKCPEPAFPPFVCTEEVAKTSLIMTLIPPRIP